MVGVPFHTFVMQIYDVKLCLIDVVYVHFS